MDVWKQILIYSSGVLTGWMIETIILLIIIITSGRNDGK